MAKYRGLLIALAVVGVGVIAFHRLAIAFPVAQPLYREVPLSNQPKITDLPTEPEQIISAIYPQHRLDSKPQLTINTLAQDKTRWIVSVTREAEGDDSVSKVRYRMKYVADGEQWRLVWTGVQFKCQPGRGNPFWPFWSSGLCS